jgi:hypothetical protein
MITRTMLGKEKNHASAFLFQGGSQFEGYPLPSFRLGSSLPYTTFSSATLSDDAGNNKQQRTMRMVPNHEN